MAIYQGNVDLLCYAAACIQIDVAHLQVFRIVGIAFGIISTYLRVYKVYALSIYAMVYCALKSNFLMKEVNKTCFDIISLKTC